MNRSFNNKAQTLRQSDLDAVEVKSKVSMQFYFLSTLGMCFLFRVFFGGGNHAIVLLCLHNSIPDQFQCYKKRSAF